MLAQSNIFYVYAYLREDGTPYYIGKGKNNRMKSTNHNINMPADKTRIIILESNLTEFGAFALERRMIRWYGRKDNNTGILRNLTDGGEGPSGRILSKTHRKNISESNKGIIKSPEWRKNLGDSARGKKKGKQKNPRKKLVCTHCQMIGDSTNMKRWHFDNCKFK